MLKSRDKVCGSELPCRYFRSVKDRCSGSSSGTLEAGTLSSRSHHAHLNTPQHCPAPVIPCHQQVSVIEPLVYCLDTRTEARSKGRGKNVFFESQLGAEPWLDEGKYESCVG